MKEVVLIITQTTEDEVRRRILRNAEQIPWPKEEEDE